MKTLKKNQRGQALVEFALVVPMLVLVVIAIVEFSRIWETLNLLTSAAREGARVASLTNPVSTSQATTAAQNVLTAGGISTPPTITVSGPNASNEVTVTVQVMFVPATGLSIPGISYRQLQRQATMRWEG